MGCCFFFFEHDSAQPEDSRGTINPISGKKMTWGASEISRGALVCTEGKMDFLDLYVHFKMFGE